MKGLTKADYADAIAVQDACNLSGVVRSYCDVMHRIFEECGGTQERNTHPIAVMYSSKIASLTGSDITEVFAKSYDECKANS